MEPEVKRAPLIKDPALTAAVAFAIALVAFSAATGVNRFLVKRFLRLPDGATVEEVKVVAQEKATEKATDKAAEKNTSPTDTPTGSAAAEVSSEEGDEPDTPHRTSVTRASPLGKRAYVDPILKRNIFDSSAVGVASTSPDGTGNGEMRRTDLKVTLLATVVATPDDYSSALIASETAKGTFATGYGIKDDLLGEATIEAIEKKRVIIRRTDGNREYIDMEGASTLARSTSAVEGGAETAEGVTKTGDNSYTVDASLVAEAFANIDKLTSQVRAIPHRGPDGEIDGFRLSAIRRGSILNKLGVKNGDIIHGVNGTPLTSASGAMSAFQTLQNEKSFSFEVTRRNQKQNFQYEIR